MSAAEFLENKGIHHYMYLRVLDSKFKQHSIVDLMEEYAKIKNKNEKTNLHTTSIPGVYTIPG